MIGKLIEVQIMLFGALVTPRDLGFKGKMPYGRICREAFKNGLGFYPKGEIRRPGWERIESAIKPGMIVRIPIDSGGKEGEGYSNKNYILSKGFGLGRAPVKETELFCLDSLFLFSVERIMASYVISLLETESYAPSVPQLNPDWDPTL